MAVSTRACLHQIEFGWRGTRSSRVQLAQLTARVFAPVGPVRTARLRSPLHLGCLLGRGPWLRGQGERLTASVPELNMPPPSPSPGYPEFPDPAQREPP